MRLTASAVQIDTDPHPAFPVLSAGNFAEVAPERISIVSWSLVGDPVERGLRDLARRLWPQAKWYTGSRYVFVAYISCRPYHNLSAFCHMARHVPGLPAQDVTANYFQDAPVAPSPPALLPGVAGRALALPRLARAVLELAPRLTELESAVAELEARTRMCLARRSPIVLGQTFARAREVVDDAWAAHYLTTLVLVPIRRLLSGVGDRVTGHWSEIEPYIADADELVWSSLQPVRALDQPIGPAEFLGHAFYEIADDREPWSRFANAGARLAQTTETAPSRDGGVARRGGLLPGDRSLSDVEPRLARIGLSQLMRLFADTMARREETKSLTMRALHACRRLVPVVAEAIGLDDEDWPYLTAGELAGGGEPRDLRATAQRRRLACAEALERTTPEILDVRGDSRERARGDRRRPAGRGVSPGLVVGVVVDDPRGGPHGREQSRILVCESADAQIQPLLTLVDGLITARGSELSHVSIIVREHGIPAVVGHPLARELRPGQRVQLNGTTGEVTLVE